MRNLKFSLKGFIGAMIMALMVGFIASVATGSAMISVVAACVSMALSLIPNTRGKESGLACMAIQAEIWQSHIEGNLFKNNDFLTKSADASQYVLSGKVVHIPQAGAKASVTKNRSSLPASVTQRTDSDVTYTLDTYSTDPMLLQDAEEAELTYDKRSSLISEHERALNETIADNVLITWSPSLAAQMVRTTGDAIDTHLADTTGTRKKLKIADFKNAIKVLDKQNVSPAMRYCSISTEMMSQLTEELTENQLSAFSKTFDPAKGILGELLGVTIYQRSSVVTYTNAATPVVNAYGAAANADDNDAVLIWQADCVERAVGATKFFDRTNDPTYYGDIYSFETRVGARKRRTNQEGVVAIIQAAGAGN
jgi:hypothetical protein